MNKKRFFFAVGRFFSPIYSLLMRLRVVLYTRRIFPVAQFNVPVISVGNLVLGGTGKTPLVKYIAGILRDKGLKTAVISRGYGGRARGAVNIVSDGMNVLLDAVQAGDEPLFLAETLSGVMVLTGAVRKLPAAEAVRRGAEILVLDDGFQHLAVDRDIDLVLFNGDNLVGNNRVFPGGDLREPFTALKRCHCFLLTGICERNRKQVEQFSRMLSERFPGKQVFLAEYYPETLVGFSGTEEMKKEEVRKGYGFCGIARPESFRNTLIDFGIQLSGFQEFPDHYRYSDVDISQVMSNARCSGADMLITTEKDMVKLKKFSFDLPVYALKMALRLPEEFDAFIFKELGNTSKMNQ